jgi:hypothetical protein
VAPRPFGRNLVNFVTQSRNEDQRMFAVRAYAARNYGYNHSYDPTDGPRSIDPGLSFLTEGDVRKRPAEHPLTSGKQA